VRVPVGRFWDGVARVTGVRALARRPRVARRGTIAAMRSVTSRAAPPAEPDATIFQQRAIARRCVARNTRRCAIAGETNA
jgi:hypothetical protein